MVRSLDAKTPSALRTVSETHTSVVGSERVALPGARATGPTNPHSKVQVTLKLRRQKKLPELDDRPEKSLTQEEMAQYGASKADIDKTSEVFAKAGLKTVATSQAARTVQLAGTVAQMENAFQVKLFNYTHPTGNYRGRVGSVHVPSEVGDIVEGVFGLDNRRVAFRSKHVAVHAANSPSLNGIPAGTFTPAQLASHYDFPEGRGQGQTVGLLEFGGGYFPDDLQQFCTLANVAVPNVIPISADGTSTSAHDGEEGEVMLDVEVIAGVCPESTIVVYFAQFTEAGWIAAMDTVLQDHQNRPGVISVSWGAAEDTWIWSDSAMMQVNQSLLEAAHRGITFCAAAGDDGSSAADLDGHAHVIFPGTSKYALSVGGTTVTDISPGATDIVWFEGDGLRSDGGGSTGGGVSAVEQRPVWQQAINIPSVNPGAITGRIMPDLAANADWNASPYLLVVDGAAQGNGGTSAATPLTASLITLINAKRPPFKRVGYLTPLLYRAKGHHHQTIGERSCTDITSGNNDTAAAGGYSAGPGYDAVSGWGTPNGMKMLAALEGV